MNGSAIIAEARYWGDGNALTTDLDATTLLRHLNAAYEQVVGLIQNCDGLWQFDDTNFTNFPIGTTTLVNSQADYTFASDVLDVEQVAVLDSSNNFQLLEAIDRSQMQGLDPTEFEEIDGLPKYYDKNGNSLILYPAPDNGVSVTLAAGLKVTFKRTADLFTVAQLTTATKEPGFAAPYHMILAYKTALPFCMKYRPNRVSLLLREIERLEKAIVKYYGRREQDRRKVLIPHGISHR